MAKRKRHEGKKAPAEDSQAPSGEATPPPSDPPPASEPLATRDPRTPEDPLEQVRRERDEYLDLLQRTKAEYLNYRRRSLRELDAARNHGVREFVKDLLSVFDHLEHAVRAASEGSDPERVREGVAMIVMELQMLLERRDIVRIRDTQVPFDPAVHEAVEEVHDAGAPDRTVVEVLREGYRQGEHLLRAARVRVSRRAPIPSGDPPAAGDGAQPHAQPRAGDEGERGDPEARAEGGGCGEPGASEDGEENGGRAGEGDGGSRGDI